MSEIVTVGLDLAKNVFQVHGADAAGRVLLRKKLRRDQVLDFSGAFPLASLRWKPVVVPISGAARSGSWAMRCG